MAVYVVSGKLGSGKGLYCVHKIQQALYDGRRVATNFDLKMENMLPHRSKKTAIRVPDKPLAQDLDDIGHGNPDNRYDESKAGVLVLDELGSWLNSRDFQSPERTKLIDWLIHARKKGWDVYLVVQNIEMIDKQVRVGLAEYLVKCVRADKMRIPMVGAFLGKLGKLPRFHIANILMPDVPGVVVDREWYRNTDLYEAYDTLQIFRDWHRNPADPGFKDETCLGPYSYLSPWHLTNHQGDKAALPLLQRLMPRVFNAPARPALKPKNRQVVAAAKLAKAEAWQAARRALEVAA